MRLPVAFCAVIVLILAACGVQAEPDAEPEGRVATLNGDPPIIIAHRGASGERPEHTLAAYQLAIEQGPILSNPTWC